MSPRCAELVEGARAHHRNGRYAAALELMARAVRLEPRSAALRAERADMLCLENRFPEALRDAEAAVKLSGGDEKLVFARLRVLARAGLLARARAEAARLSRSPRARAEALFYRGVLSLRARRPREAADEFAAAGRAAGSNDGLVLRARFYRAAALAAASAPREKVRGPALRLCGLGLFPPYTTSLAAARALAGCDRLINNLSEIETWEFLNALGAGIRCVTYIDGGNDSFVADCVFRELAAGRVVAFVTRGHAMVYGSLGTSLVKRCEEKGIPCEVSEAVSSVDVILDYAARVLSFERGGAQVLDRKRVEADGVPDPRRPLIVGFNSGRVDGAGVRAVAAALRRAYPASQPCFLFGPRYDAAPRPLSLGALARRRPAIEASMMLLVAPRGGR